MEINQQKSEIAEIIENPKKLGIERGKVGYKNPPKEFQFKKGEVNNPNGRGKGVKNFDTIFEEAIKEIVKSKKLPIKDPEKELMIKGIIEALKGNHNFWKSLAEFRYGKPKETHAFEPGEGFVGVIYLPRRKQDENKQLNEPKNE